MSARVGTHQWLFNQSKIQLQVAYFKLTILECFAPTNEATDEDKDDWYEQLQ